MNRRNIKLILTFLFVLFIIGIAFFGYLYYDNSVSVDANLARYNELQADIIQLNSELSKLSADVDSQLLESRADLIYEEKRIPAEIRINMVIQEILAIGEYYGVIVIPLSADDWSAENIGAHEYQKLVITINVSGSWDALVNFLSSLQSSNYLTLFCSSLDTTVSPGGQTDTQLTLSIYSRTLDGE